MPCQPSLSTDGTPTDGSTTGREQLRRGRRRRRTMRETSAGGLVVDRLTHARRAVLIGRVNRAGALEWVLPKGHLEPSETLEQAAVREVREETGLRASVVGRLGSIDYWFGVNGRRVHKTVHHFLLVAVDGKLETDDKEVTEVAWVPLAELAGRLRHESERRLVENVPDTVAAARTETGRVAS